MSKQLTAAELKMISQLLKEASNEFSNHGCNDMDIPNTDENKQMLIRMVRETWDPRDAAEEIETIESCKKKTLYTYDWMLMEYLAQRCDEAAKKKSKK